MNDFDLAKLKRLAAEPGDISYDRLAFWMADNAQEIICTLEQLQRDLDEARKDSARYRWLRIADWDEIERAYWDSHVQNATSRDESANRLDAVIDAFSAPSSDQIPILRF